MKRIFLLFTIFFAFNVLLLAQGWQELGIGSQALNANNTINVICMDSGGIVYAGGSFTDSSSYTSGTGYIAKWDGTTWSRLGDDTLLSDITSLCIDAQHNLYAAAFVKDTDRRYKVMKWNGVSWNELGTGINTLNANSSINSICTDAMGNIYAAGSFTDSPSYPAGHCYVAKWNGATWTQLGTGSNALNANYNIMSIVADAKGNIYAAGGFRYIPGGYCYVAKWNGTGWSELGTGSNALNANHAIWTLHADVYGNIYAGGFFTTGGSSDYYIAKWDGTTWGQLGMGSNELNINGAILSITTDIPGNVYAAGYFTDSNGANYVAKWNGKSWSQSGGTSNGLNANGTIFTICADSVGNIYAAGDFSDGSTYDEGHRYIAVYNHRYDAITLVVSEGNDKINVYPNPANNRINISVTDNLIDRRFSLSDAASKVVYSGIVAKNNTSLNMSQIPSGVYLLQVDTYSGPPIKIIKE